MKFIEFLINYLFIYRSKRINFLSEFKNRREILINIQINSYEIIFCDVYNLINVFLNVRVFDYQGFQINDLFNVIIH